MQQLFEQKFIGPKDFDRFVVALDKGDGALYLMDEVDYAAAKDLVDLGASALFFLPAGAIAIFDAYFDPDLPDAPDCPDSPKFVYNYRVYNNSKLFIQPEDFDFRSVTGECSLYCPPGSSNKLKNSQCKPATQNATCSIG